MRGHLVGARTADTGTRTAHRGAPWKDDTHAARLGHSLLTAHLAGIKAMRRWECNAAGVSPGRVRAPALPAHTLRPLGPKRHLVLSLIGSETRHLLVCALPLAAQEPRGFIFCGRTSGFGLRRTGHQADYTEPGARVATAPPVTPLLPVFRSLQECALLSGRCHSCIFKPEFSSNVPGEALVSLESDCVFIQLLKIPPHLPD